MGLHYVDKRSALASLGELLERRGWTLFGYTEDRSDSMTDYYSPAHWDGVATKGDAVVVAGGWSPQRAQQQSGRQEKRNKRHPDVECPKCSGTGEHPQLYGVEGWTLEKARANPDAWHLAELLAKHPGAVPLDQAANRLPGVAVRMPDGSRIHAGLLRDCVSPIPFCGGGGAAACDKCSGAGTYSPGWDEIDGPKWPVFQGNPGRSVWHVERGGRIVAHGVGLYSAGRSWQPTERRTADDPLVILADRIDRAAADAPAAEAPTPELVPGVQGATVTPSTVNPENVEVRFPAKPAEDVRAALKAAGFRWSGRTCCWYGRADRLPAALK